MYDEGNNLSPSSFIPFCELGGNMTSVGVKTDNNELPICNSFQATILIDQLCYEIDLEKFKNKDNIEKDLNLGFVFVMDYNEDRQITFNEINDDLDERSLVGTDVETDHKENALIYLNTIGE